MVVRHQRPVWLESHERGEKFAVLRGQRPWKVMVESGLNGLKSSQIDLINGHADKARLVFVLKRSRLRKEYLVNGAVMPSHIADKSRHDVLAQTISVIHVLHIKNIARMLPVQCRDKFAAV